MTNKKINLKEKTIKVEEKMFLLQNINNENDFSICKLKSWGDYKMMRKIYSAVYRNYRFLHF
jgi:hypothetical protein